MNNTPDDKDTLTRDFVKFTYNICKTIGNKKIPKKDIKNFLQHIAINTKDEWFDD